MSESDDTMQCCANCGVAEGDDIKLRKCTACYLVRYCGVKCQMDHRKQHKKECKKRAAELKDELLFKQPESSHLGDCPICCLPLPIDLSKCGMHPCCCKRICAGCIYATMVRESQRRLQHTCPFCREPVPKTNEQIYEQLKKRIKANDPVAMREMGTDRCDKGDYNAAFEYFTKAAALGDVEAHYRLSVLFREGKGVEKDDKKDLYHTEQAVIAGHPRARHHLGYVEGLSGRNDRAAKHYTIAAKLGNKDSLNALKNGYKARHVSKDDFTDALRGYQAAIEAMKSPQREAAAEFARQTADREKRGI